MAVDHVFFMQCLVTLCIIGISVALIFLQPNDGSFTIGIAMLSSITGYWFPNPNRKQQNSSNSNDTNNSNSNSNNSNNSNSSNTDPETGNGIDFSNILSGLGRRRRRRHNETNETNEKNETCDGDHKDDGHDGPGDHSVSVNINIENDNGSDSDSEDEESPLKQGIKKLGSSVKDTISRIESGDLPYIHVDGEFPQQQFRVKPKSVKEDEVDSVNDAHIAV